MTVIVLIGLVHLAFDLLLPPSVRSSFPHVLLMAATMLAVAAPPFALLCLTALRRLTTTQARVAEESALHQQAVARFRDFAISSSDWLWEMDATLRFTYLSERIRSASGADPAFFIGKRRDELMKDPEKQEGLREHLADLEARRPFRDFTYEFVGPRGDRRHFKISGVPVFDRQGRFSGYRGTGTNITEQVRAEERFRHLAHHDSLTDLPNRALFQDRLRQAIAQAQRSGRKLAVLQLDLDRLKDVNDTLGHAAGDAFLREAASRVTRCVRGADTVARLGGDEFAVVLTELGSSTGASRVARQVVDELARPLEFQGQTIHAGTSIGVTIYPDDGADPDLLFKNADIALYRAKAAGGCTYSFFLPEMKEQVERRRQIEADLRRALAQEDFVLHYQPVISLEDGALLSFEALVHWRHPERGLIPPREFRSVAEEAGLAVAIGELALRRACAQARRWLDHGCLLGRISIDTPVAHFRRGGLARTVKQVLRDTGLPPGHLELEVTEELLMQCDRQAVLDTVHELRRIGVTFALEHFGIGCASLSRLKHFSGDRLKIDSSFVGDIGIDPEGAAIVRAVINLGHSLGFKVIAEGIESEEQRVFLRLHGCDCGQGGHFAPPLAPAEAHRFLHHAARSQRPAARSRSAMRHAGIPAA